MMTSRWMDIKMDLRLTSLQMYANTCKHLNAYKGVRQPALYDTSVRAVTCGGCGGEQQKEMLSSGSRAARSKSGKSAMSTLALPTRKLLKQVCPT